MDKQGARTLRTLFASHWLSAVICLLLAAVPGTALAGPYAQSAHGDAVVGVRRAVSGLSSPGPYVTGNCAHCHEQHASIGGSEPQPGNSGPSGQRGYQNPSEPANAPQAPPMPATAANSGDGFKDECIDDIHF